MTTASRETLHLDALEAQTKLRERLAGLARTEAYLRRTELRAECEALWLGAREAQGLMSELWVEPLFPAGLSEFSLATFPGVSDGLLGQIRRTGAMPVDRLLYRHQEEALSFELDSRSRGERPALIITAPTGAGKTEAFLLPMLNDLFARPREEGERGVRAILLYPLNALVNDQVERLFTWLRGQNGVTFVHYTGETPSVDAGDLEEQRDPCRQLTRLEAQRNPPDILVTNYSMLEYLLCRPQDAVLFDGALKTVVVDEAHLYNGSLATDIALLLRRVVLKDDGMFAFAGLWESWKDRTTGQKLRTFTILTTDPNELMEPIHNRMPVILHRRDYERWLAPTDPANLPIDLLRPYPADEMKAWKVGKAVGNTRNNDPSLIEPLKDEEVTAPLTLFG